MRINYNYQVALIILCIDICKSTGTSDIFDYLRERRDEVKASNGSDTGISYVSKVDFANVHQFKLDRAPIHYFAELDDKLFLIDSNFYIMENGTFTLFHDINYSSEVTFARGVKHKKQQFVLLQFKTGWWKFYKYESRNLKLIHSISANSSSSFIKMYSKERNGYLYLFLVFDNLILIYKWNEYYLYQVREYKNLKNITDFGMLNDHHRDMLIFLTNSNDKSILYLYKIEESDDLKKIQQFSLVASRNLVTFYYQNRNYLITLGEILNLYVILDDGLDLVNQFNGLGHPKNILVTHIRNNPIIFIVEKANIVAVTMNEKGLEALNGYKPDLEEILHSYIQNNDTLYLIGLNKSNDVIFSQINIFTEIKQLETDSDESDVVKCFESLSKHQNIHTQKIISKRNTGDSNSNTFDATNFKGKIQELVDKLDEVAADLSSLKEKANRLLNKDNLVINGMFRMTDGILQAETLDCKDTSTLVFVNGIHWLPSQWLSLTKPQTILKPVLLKKLVVKNLKFSNKDNIFSDFLQRHSNISFSEVNKIGNLTAGSIKSDMINSIQFSDIYLLGDRSKIEGTKQFRDIETEKATVRNINKKNTTVFLGAFAKVVQDKTVYINKLKVKRINNVNWDEFRKSVVVKDIPAIIKGNLTFNVVEAAKLRVMTISNIDVNRFMTKKTNQTISSSFFVDHIFVNNLVCNKLNSLTLPDDVVTFYPPNNEIFGPVSIRRISIRHLNLLGPVDNSTLGKLGNRFLGSNESDLLQMYPEKVRILGNLIVTNLYTSSDSTIYLNDIRFDINLANSYWLKNTFQEVPITPIMKKGISCPNLKISYLNKSPLRNYILNNHADKQPAHFHFENVIIGGNLDRNESKIHKPNLANISIRSVKINGRYNIAGKKIFEKPVKVDNLWIDNLEISTIHPDAANLRNVMEFDHIVLRKDLITKKANVTNINGFYLKNTIADAIYVDEEINIGAMKFSNLKIRNLYTSSINHLQVEQFLKEMNRIRSQNKVESVKVDGTLTGKNVQVLELINGYPISVLSEKCDQTTKINHDNVYIPGIVQTKYLEVLYINDINVYTTFNNVLTKKWPQTITGHYEFGILKTVNLITPKINDLDIENPINSKSRDPIVIESDLHLHSAKFLKSVTSNFNACNLTDIETKILKQNSRKWQSITIESNVSTKGNDTFSLILDPSGFVNKIRENIIKAPIKFNNLSAKKVICSKYINNINITSMVENALLQNKEKQIVTGRKTFTNVTAKEALVLKNALIPIVNSMNITKINGSIFKFVKFSEKRIRGKKTFYNGIQTTKLYTPGLILGVNKYPSFEELETIPAAIFSKLIVDENFNINFVNNISFNKFLDNIFYKMSAKTQILDGVYNFDKIIFESDVQVDQINNLKFGDIVIDSGVQAIHGQKLFSDTIQAKKNISIGKLNGYNITQLYLNSILLNKHNSISNNLVFNMNAKIKGNISARSINSIPIDEIKRSISTTKPKFDENLYGKHLADLGKIIDDSMEKAKDMGKRFLYIENANLYNSTTPNIKNAYVTKIKDDVMFHIESREDGPNCGLPTGCSCPKQQIIQLGDDHSVKILPQEAYTRVFSYEGGQVVIHVITNTISSDPRCRVPNTSSNKELTKMMWMRKTANRTKTGKSKHNITGYVKDVKFFSMADFIYSIICTSYDPITNITSGVCFINRYFIEEDEVTHLQTIKHKYINTINVFKPYGRNMLIVTAQKENLENYTYVYYFDNKHQKFNLTNIIPGDERISSSVVSLPVISFLVLAKNNQIRILNLDPRGLKTDKIDPLFFDYYPVDISTFNLQGSSSQDAFLLAFNQNEMSIYRYEYSGGWKLLQRGKVEGLRQIIPFSIENNLYLLAVFKNSTNLLHVVSQLPN